MVLDLRLPDMTGFEVLEQLRDTPKLQDLPVVVFTGRELTAEEDAQLHTLARSVVVKDVESPERLLDETALVPASRDRRPAHAKSSRCSTACTDPTMRWQAARCWWSMTTCATSSR